MDFGRRPTIGPRPMDFGKIRNSAATATEVFGQGLGAQKGSGGKEEKVEYVVDGVRQYDLVNAVVRCES